MCTHTNEKQKIRLNNVRAVSTALHGPTRGSSTKPGRSGPSRGQGRGRHVRFGGMNVLYDSEGYEYPVDNYRQIYVPLEAESADASVVTEEETEKGYKN